MYFLFKIRQSRKSLIRFDWPLRYLRGLFCWEIGDSPLFYKKGTVPNFQFSRPLTAEQLISQNKKNDHYNQSDQDVRQQEHQEHADCHPEQYKSNNPFHALLRSYILTYSICEKVHPIYSHRMHLHI